MRAAIMAFSLHPQLQRARCPPVRVFNFDLNFGVLVLPMYIKCFMATLLPGTLPAAHTPKQGIEKSAVILTASTLKAL